VGGSRLTDRVHPTALAARRHVVCMTVEGGASTELTAEMEWREAQCALRALRRLFANDQAATEGWASEPLAHGFRVSKGGCTATFEVTPAGTRDLAGRAHPITARERARARPQTG
jgi:hypothetical protein